MNFELVKDFTTQDPQLSHLGVISDINGMICNKGSDKKSCDIMKNEDINILDCKREEDKVKYPNLKSENTQKNQVIRVNILFMMK